MTVLLRITEFNALSTGKKKAIRKSYPVPILSEAVPQNVYEDSDGKQWASYTDGRFSPIQIAILASMSVNRKALVDYNSPYVNDDVEDEDSWQKECKAVLKNEVPVPMTLPEDVETEDEFGPTLQEVRKAQESVEGELDDVMRVIGNVSDNENYTRVDPKNVITQ